MSLSCTFLCHEMQTVLRPLLLLLLLLLLL
jgi:hypothetical protein